MTRIFANANHDRGHGSLPPLVSFHSLFAANQQKHKLMGNTVFVAFCAVEVKRHNHIQWRAHAQLAGASNEI